MYVEMKQEFHTPVMVREVLEYLQPVPGKIIVDATAGTGGHSSVIAEHLMPFGKLLCIDRDKESLLIAKERLAAFHDICDFVHGNFSSIDQILREKNINAVDGILLDIGISSFQLDNPERGFSFQNAGPLDMRMDRTSSISAFDLVNNLNEEEISHLLRVFGQERWHNRIARLVVSEREKHPISTTEELNDIVMRAIPYHQKMRHYRIHPATRTFQAVRIAVNRELEALESSLRKIVDYLNPGARICVISFHSLEDRIVKLQFRSWAAEHKIKILTPKPLIPLASECVVNPRSRSAKFRAAEKI